MKRPLVSILIPTHDRPECAVAGIRAVLAASPDLEVVVSDTSAQDNISPAFAGKLPARVKLLRPGRPMSVVDNFNHILAAANGDFLVFIGDDDLVAPEIAEVAAWAKREGIDSLSFNFPVLYYWPSFESTTRWRADSATLVFGHYNGQVHAVDTRAGLTGALRQLGSGVLGMPRAYAGMISRGLVQHIIERHGALFGGVSPDIYSAALISLEAQRAVRLDFPVVIPGASGSSTSGQSARGRHVGGLRDNAHIGAFKNIVWDVRVPEYYSVPTVWGYSLLKAVEDKPDWLARADFAHLYLKCLLTAPSYRGLVWGCFKTLVRHRGLWRTLIQTGSALYREGRRGALALLGRLHRSAESSQRVLSGIADSEAALTALIQHRVSSPIHLNLPAGWR